jgi:hypothetical protein
LARLSTFASTQGKAKTWSFSPRQEKRDRAKPEKAKAAHKRPVSNISANLSDYAQSRLYNAVRAKSFDASGDTSNAVVPPAKAPL